MPEQDSTPYAESVDREKLILDHVPLLKHIVGRMALDMPSSVDREDLQGFGMIGLIRAADSWEPGRGLKFSTYAYTKVRGAILDELRRQDFLPRGRRERVRELDGVIAELEQRNGVTPTPRDAIGARRSTQRRKARCAHECCDGSTSSSARPATSRRRQPA